MLNPFIELIASIISIYTFIVFAWVIMSLLIQFEVINKYNRLVRQIFTALSQMVEPALEPFRRLQRKLFPRLYSVDLSPIILILLLHFVRSALFHWFWSIPAA